MLVISSEWEEGFSLRDELLSEWLFPLQRKKKRNCIFKCHCHLTQRTHNSVTKSTENKNTQSSYSFQLLDIKKEVGGDYTREKTNFATIKI